MRKRTTANAGSLGRLPPKHAAVVSSRLEGGVVPLPFHRADHAVKVCRPTNRQRLREVGHTLLSTKTGGRGGKGGGGGEAGEGTCWKSFATTSGLAPLMPFSSTSEKRREKLMPDLANFSASSRFTWQDAAG